MKSATTKILIVDDDASIRKLLKQWLETAGYNVESAIDGEDGNMKFTEDPPDVIVTDIFMPRLNGFNFITAVRDVDPSVGIIAMSGRDTMTKSTVLRHTRELGADDVIRKPLDKNKILDMVAALCKLKRIRTEMACA